MSTGLIFTFCFLWVLFNSTSTNFLLEVNKDASSHLDSKYYKMQVHILIQWSCRGEIEAYRTPEAFKEFGQVIQASSDGEKFGPHDARLDLTQGTPRCASHLFLGTIGFLSISNTERCWLSSMSKRNFVECMIY